VQGDRASVRLGALTLQTNHCQGTAAQRHVAVRPNRVNILPPGSPHALEASIQKATYVGEQMEYMVHTPLGELFVTSPDTEHPVAAGASVSLAFVEGDVVLLSD
jgi:iron(III) transport system ATP-binding protein